MKDSNTEKSLKKLDEIYKKENIYRNKHVYENIIDNCSMYAVKPNMDKFWLMDNYVLAEWNNCQHPNPFETWKFSTVEAAKESFHDIMDN